MKVYIPWTSLHGPLGVFTDINKAKREVKEVGWRKVKFFETEIQIENKDNPECCSMQRMFGNH